MAVFSHICRTGAGFITKPNKRLFPSPVLSYIESNGPDKCFNCREPIIKQFCNSPAVFRSIVNIKPLPDVQFVGALSAIFHSPFFRGVLRGALQRTERLEEASNHFTIKSSIAARKG